MYTKYYSPKKETPNQKKRLDWEFHVSWLKHGFKFMKTSLKSLRKLNPTNINLGEIEHYLMLIEKLIKHLDDEQSN